MRILLLTSFCCLFIGQVFAQDKWEQSYRRQRVFVENKGQFKEDEKELGQKIYYVADWGTTRIFFTERGWTYSFLEVSKNENEADDFIASSVEEYKLNEKKSEKFSYKRDDVHVALLNASIEYAASKKLDFYSNYCVSRNGELVSVNGAACFEELRILDAWNGIDLVFSVHPINGLKYAFELSESAMESDIKFEYSRKINKYYRNRDR